MTSRDTPSNSGSIIGYFSWFVGALGQVGFMGSMAQSHLPPLAVFLMFIMPWILVFGGTLMGEPHRAPRLFGFCLGLAVGWFATVSVAAEFLYHHGFMPQGSSWISASLSRVLMHVGWLGLIYVAPTRSQADPKPTVAAPQAAEGV
ncbi:hypothetical protein AYO49_05240 [Verrucomicrobiaceae bacterium SCGC AG-212-N21]|nr:hypothetical protein AYO49_05240 [Verrucomicrobiaceae bacterium SCGC AG-212-N21]